MIFAQTGAADTYDVLIGIVGLTTAVVSLLTSVVVLLAATAFRSGMGK